MKPEGEDDNEHFPVRSGADHRDTVCPPFLQYSNRFVCNAWDARASGFGKDAAVDVRNSDPHDLASPLFANLCEKIGELIVGLEIQPPRPSFQKCQVLAGLPGEVISY
jgi:hypothetical protein